MKKKIILFLSFLLTAIFLSGCKSSVLKTVECDNQHNKQISYSYIYSLGKENNVRVSNYTRLTNSLDVTVRIFNREIEIQQINFTILIYTVIAGVIFFTVLAVLLIFAIGYAIGCLRNIKKE